MQKAFRLHFDFAGDVVYEASQLGSNSICGGDEKSTVSSSVECQLCNESPRRFAYAANFRFPALHVRDAELATDFCAVAANR